MHQQATSGRRFRSTRTTAAALALVAILAGIAVAYFLTSKEYAGNKALGGTLTVDADLPIDFSDEPLYPTSPPVAPEPTDQPAFIENELGLAESDWAYAEKDFTIDNFNTVKVEYQLFATCEECLEDPADTAEQAAARAEKRQQFEDLWVEISGGPADHVDKRWRLAEMTPTNPHFLGTIAAGDPATYTVRLWLENAPDRAQAQSIESLWEFFINAKTPV